MAFANFWCAHEELKNIIFSTIVIYVLFQRYTTVKQDRIFNLITSCKILVTI